MADTEKTAKKFFYRCRICGAICNWSPGSNAPHCFDCGIMGTMSIVKIPLQEKQPSGEE